MDDCIFCKIIKGEIPSRKVYENDDVMVIMDVDPKVDGHSLVLPKKHITDLTELSDDDATKLNAAVKFIAPRIANRVNAKGFTVGVNYGASQAVKHYHMHILPNFLLDIPSSGKTIDEIFEMIKEK